MLALALVIIVAVLSGSVHHYINFQKKGIFRDQGGKELF